MHPLLLLAALVAAEPDKPFAITVVDAQTGRGVNKLSIWRSDPWYYPLDLADRSALAIRFDGNVARDVERISVPTASID